MYQTRKQLLRRTGSAILVLLLLVTMIGVTPAARAAEADGVVVELHYHRPDGDYNGWDVFFWDEGGPNDYGGRDFVLEDEGVVAALEIAPGTTKIGFIVRLGGDSWENKDVNADQFIDIAEVASGTVHIMVESGVEGYTKEYGVDAVTEIKVTNARYMIDDGTVSITLTGTPAGDPADMFQVLNAANQAIAIIGAAETAQGEYILELGEALDPIKAYQLVFDGTEYQIFIPNVYSTEDFEAEYTYAGDDLGATWTKEKTTFRVWAPTANSVTVNLYASGTAGTDDLIEQLLMTADVNGTWVAEKEADLNGIYYTYELAVGNQVNEACDPYARTTGVNGNRAMVIDLASTNPDGWDTDTNPNAGLSYNDAIIYELHVRDLSSDASSGITNAGKFLGLTETGTTTPGGVPTGIDHIKDLGVTHVHLLPVYDFGSVDETRLDQEQFNWGYDPVNYNVPEGSYSTDPYNGEVRVAEMKQMVKSLHDNGISVIMDVVYNHVYDAENFCFNLIVPGYFSRIDENGAYSNGSECGNDTASERSMVRKYIVDSVKYWADEYHINGFRFDLVGLIDIDTINQIVEEVHATHPDVIFYGEGWTMNTAVTKTGVTLATQSNSARTPGFAYFSDTIRDALRGSASKGYVSGAGGQDTTIRQTYMGLASWCVTPAQTINYVSCHDNNTLIDRITLSTPDAAREDQIRMNNLAAAIYLTAEGIPLMQAGEEMLRTKPNADGSLNENSYNAPDSVNSIKWSTLESKEYQDVFEYYKGLIAFRKAHGALRLTNAEDVRENVTAVNGLPANVVAFQINGGVNAEISDGMFVIFNPNSASQEIELPDGTWDVYINGEKAGMDVLETITEGTVTVEPISAMVLVKGNGNPAPVANTDTSAAEMETPANDTALWAAILVAVIAVIGAVLVYRGRKSREG